MPNYRSNALICSVVLTVSCSAWQPRDFSLLPVWGQTISFNLSTCVGFRTYCTGDLLLCSPFLCSHYTADTHYWSIFKSQINLRNERFDFLGTNLFLLHLAIFWWHFISSGCCAHGIEMGCLIMELPYANHQMTRMRTHFKIRGVHQQFRQGTIRVGVVCTCHESNVDFSYFFCMCARATNDQTDTVKCNILHSHNGKQVEVSNTDEQKGGWRGSFLNDRKFTKFHVLIYMWIWSATLFFSCSILSIFAIHLPGM